MKKTNPKTNPAFTQYYTFPNGWNAEAEKRKLGVWLERIFAK